jgi:hypothetical protein
MELAAEPSGVALKDTDQSIGARTRPDPAVGGMVILARREGSE